MQDAIINGSGNSRFLKSINEFLTLYPDYESFALALIEGTLPIDLNGINPAGWAQQGTPLNKANLLSDATETAIWGNTGNRTVDAALAQLFSSDLKLITGSYTGDGAATRTINLGVYPKAAIVTRRNGFTDKYSTLALRDFVSYYNPEYPILKIIGNGFEVYYSLFSGQTNTMAVTNGANEVYYYVAFY